MSQEQFTKGVIIKTLYYKTQPCGIIEYVANEETGEKAQILYNEKSLKRGWDIKKIKLNDEVLFQIEDYKTYSGESKLVPKYLHLENESEDEEDNKYAKLLTTDKLKDWAFIFEGKYQELANKALEENWWFGEKQKTFDNGNKDWRILKSYLSTTFTKLYHDKKIEFSDDEQYAAFNTGLVERTYYSPIIACFGKNTHQDKKQQWVLQEFSVWEETSFADKFSEIPERANYFDDPNNMFLDCELARKISPKYNHIIVDNIDRFPLEYLNDTIKESISLSDFNLRAILQSFSEDTASYEKKRKSISNLRNEMSDFCKKTKLDFEGLLKLIEDKLQKIKEVNDVKELVNYKIIDMGDLNFSETKENSETEISEEETAKKLKNLNKAIAYEVLRNKLSLDLKLLRKIAGAVNLAKDLAIKKTEWNYRTAVPMYYPRENKMMMLLPLYLDETSDEGEKKDADVALVISKYKSAYIAKTILTLEMAYLDSRLVTRPDSDWLSNKTTENFSSDEDEEIVENFNSDTDEIVDDPNS